MQDRRVFERLSVDVPLKFWDMNANSVGEAEAKDVSAIGLSFTAKDELSSGTSLGMWLEVPDNGERLYVQGKVAWSQAENSGKYRTGIKFAKPELMGMARVIKARNRLCLSF